MDADMGRVRGRSRSKAVTLATAGAAVSLILSACLPLPAVEQNVEVRRPVQSSNPVAPADGRVSVRAGDTVYVIARRFGVTQRSLIEANGLSPPYRLATRQILSVPPPNTYRVQSGDTIYGIASRFGSDQVSIVRLNKLGADSLIQVGQVLTLPATIVQVPPPATTTTTTTVVKDVGRQPLQQSEAAAESTASAASSESTAADNGDGLPPVSVLMRPRQAVKGPLAEPPARVGRFLWPVDGAITARFGPGAGGLQNDGVNIRAKRGAAVWAAENGVVVYAGNEIRGFGNLVLVRHADGWLTAYAHNDAVLVRRGDVVQRGQTIARVGSTGNVAEPQLHFEVRRHSKPVDPESVGLTRQA